MRSQGKYVINIIWWLSLFQTLFCIELTPSGSCSLESFACCNLGQHLSVAPQTAPALQQKCAALVYHRCDTGSLHSKGTEESDRSVCTIQAALSQACLGTPEPQTAGRVQTSRQELPGSQHLEECTGADTLQQTIPASTWSIWHLAGPRPMASSCAIVIGPCATKERSPLSSFSVPPVLQYPGLVNQFPPAHWRHHSWWLCNNTFTLIGLAWISSGILIHPCQINQCWITCCCSYLHASTFTHPPC